MKDATLSLAAQIVVGRCITVTRHTVQVYQHGNGVVQVTLIDAQGDEVGTFYVSYGEWVLLLLREALGR